MSDGFVATLMPTILPLVGVGIGGGLTLLASLLSDNRKARREEEHERRKLLVEEFSEQRRLIVEFDLLVMKILHGDVSHEELETLRASGIALSTNVDLFFDDPSISTDVGVIVMACYVAKQGGAVQNIDGVYATKLNAVIERMRAAAKKKRARIHNCVP